MSTVTIVIMGLGIFFAVVGLILFITKGAEGQNTLKFLGMEFKLSGSSLVFFVIGVVLVVLPFAKQEWFQNGFKGSGTGGKNTTEKAEQLFIKGDALWANGRFDDPDLADSCYSAAIALLKKFDRAIAQRAKVRIQKKQYVEATMDIRKAIAIKPDTGAYYATLARIYLLRGDTSTACDEWKKSYQYGYEKQKEYVAMFCEELKPEKIAKKDAKKTTTGGGGKTSEVVQEKPWVLRCDFYDGGQAFVNRQNDIYMNYLGQLIPIGKKRPSSDPQFAWYYSIETGTDLDLFNDLMGTNQYGVDKNGIIWGQTLYGISQVGKASPY